MKQIKLTLQTLSPVVLTGKDKYSTLTASQDFFSGTIIRGILAKRYIAAQGLNDAEQYESFRCLFFGDLKFIAAYPSEGDERAIPLPRSLQKSKDGKSYRELLYDRPEANFKSCKGFGYVKRDGTVLKVRSADIKKSICLHMSRNTDLAGQERLYGRSIEQYGNIYNYESIAAGQSFQGIIFGEENSLNVLKDGLKLPTEGLLCYVGRSKYTQYGQCRIVLKDIEDIPVLQNITSDTKLNLRLETPWIFQDMEYKAAFQSVAAQLQDLLQDKTIELEQEKIFAAAEYQDNFVGTWHMYRPRERVLSAGTVCSIRKAAPWEAEQQQKVQELLYHGFGRRTEEGFGQFRLWPESEKVEPWIWTDMQDKRKQEKLPSDGIVKTRPIVCAIIRERLEQQLRLQAYNDVQKAGEKHKELLKESVHSMARMEGLLLSWYNLNNVLSFTAYLKDEIAPGSPIDDRLNNLKLGGKSLKDMLGSEESKAYCQKVLGLEQSDEALHDLCQEMVFELNSSDKKALFYAYWSWFFRHARKKSVELRKEAV